MSESAATAWIIDRLEIENTKIEEEMGNMENCEGDSVGGKSGVRCPSTFFYAMVFTAYLIKIIYNVHTSVSSEKNKYRTECYFSSCVMDTPAACFRMCVYSLNVYDCYSQGKHQQRKDTSNNDGSNYTFVLYSSTRTVVVPP